MSFTRIPVAGQAPYDVVVGHGLRVSRTATCPDRDSRRRTSRKRRAKAPKHLRPWVGDFRT